MAANPKKITEIPTIDVSMVMVETDDESYILDTANKIAVEPQIETTDAVKLIVKNRLIAQKPEESTITGNKITLTDNVFAPELVKMLQGGTIKYWTDAKHTATSTEPTTFGIAGYTPPVTGSGEKGKVFKLHAFSAQYDTSGQIVQYEKITYPNCQGVPIAFGSEDGTFRASEYTINSAPKSNEAPYDISYVSTLPTAAAG